MFGGSMNKNLLAKSAAIVTIITILSKIFGFFRDTLIAAKFGATFVTDAYMTSLLVPNLLYNLFGLALTTTFIPLLSESKIKNGKDDMFNFANSILNLLLIISMFLFILGINFPDKIVRVLAPKFSGETFNLTVLLSRIAIINVIFMCLNSVFMAILQSLDDFFAPALTGMIMDVPIILYLLFLKNYNVIGLTAVTVLGCGLQLIVQIPWLIKNGYRYHFKIDLKDKRIKRIITLIGPVILGTGVNQISNLVDRIMASGLTSGNISALSFASRISSILYYIFASAIVMVIYPTLSRNTFDEDYTNFKRYISKGINDINIFMIPSSIAVMVLRTPIVTVLFKHGIFDEKSVSLTASALLYLSIGMLFLGIADLLNRAFYALQDTKTPMKNAAIGLCVNIILDIVTVNYMGIRGLALATSASIIVSTILLLVDLRKKVGNIGGKDIVINACKILLSTIVMCFAITLMEKFAFTQQNNFKLQLFSLFADGIVGIGVYIVMIKILKLEEFTNMLNSLFKQIKKS
jgi:putative peptidoglycan lipid II flippase